MRRARIAFAAALVAGLAGACSHPCADLAAETCARKGAGSSACASARELADRSSGRDHRACALALDVLKNERPQTR